MAIKLPNGDILRTLFEQVEENKLNIAKHYEVDRVLSDYGIKIVGSVDSADNLPNALIYDGSYGDAYTVGTGAPFDFYVFTRPNEAIGETENRWLDLGQLAIQGPAGKDSTVPGPKGDTGESSRWYVGQQAPAGPGYNDGDMFIIINQSAANNGNIYQFQNNEWLPQGNIRGPQGIPGQTIVGPPGPALTFDDLTPEQKESLRGANGVPGDAVNIVGILTSASMLPDPDTVARDTAYVVQDETGQWLYFITGTDTLIWDKVAFENGTTVLVGGNPVQTFDADSKVDKITSTAQYLRVYANYAGTEKRPIVATTPALAVDESDRIASYGPTGRSASSTVNAHLMTGNPEYNYDAANKRYVDGQIQAAKDASVAKSTATNGTYALYGSNNNSDVMRIIASTESVLKYGSIPYYVTSTDPLGNMTKTGYHLVSCTPTKDAHCATKKYVDDKAALITDNFNSRYLIGYTSYTISKLIQANVPSIIELTPIYNKATQVGQAGIGFTSTDTKYVKLKIYNTTQGTPLGVGYKSDGTQVMFNSGIQSVYMTSSDIAVAVEYTPAQLTISGT